MRAMSIETIEQKAKAAVGTSNALLGIIASDPKGTQRQWAEALGKPIGAMTRELNKLKSAKLAEDFFGKRSLTAKGKRVLRDAENEEKWAGYA